MNYCKYYQYFTNICLNVTDACNLACEYCFVNQSPHYMDLNTAKKAVDFLVKNYLTLKTEYPYIPREEITINFFGGEPLICWDNIIKPLVQYTNITYPNMIHFMLTTNGTLLNDEKIKFIKENNIKFILSMDGIKEAQALRKFHDGSSSFDILDKNLYNISNFCPDTIYRITVSPGKEQYLFKSFLYAISKNFNILNIYPNCRQEWTEEQIIVLEKELDKIFTYLLLMFENNQFPIVFLQLERYIKQILEHDLQIYNGNVKEREIIRNPCEVCGTGCITAAIDYKGDIYTCQEQTTRKNKNLFYIGNINTGISIDKHCNFLNLYQKKEKIVCKQEQLCNLCKVKATCINKNVCLSMNYDLNSNFFIKPYIDCRWQQALMERTIKLIHYLFNSQNQLFFDYLYTYFNNNEKSFNVSHIFEIDKLITKLYPLEEKAFEEMVFDFQKIKIDNLVIYGKYNFSLSEINFLSKIVG